MLKEAVAAERPPEPFIENRPAYRAVCLPPPVGGSWSSKDPNQMRRAFRLLGIDRGIVPNFGPPFSGRFADTDERRISENIGNRGDLTRFCEPCEGDWLKEKGDALVVPLGGCLLCVASAVDATGRPRIAAFHAGLPSLVDYRPLASDLGPSRRHESVLGSVRTSFWRGWQIPPERIRLECFFGLPAGTLKYHFGRPGGHLYRALLDHVQVRWGGVAAYEMEDEEGPAVVVDPGMIFVMQALDLGFGSTARSCDLPPDGPFAYTRHPREDLSGECRNLGAVIRTA